MVLSSSQKTISIIKRNNFETSWQFFLSELPSFFGNRKKLESHKKVYENEDFCNVIMPPKGTKRLEFNQYKISDKAPFIVYADLESIIEKIDGYKNNPENSSTTKASKYIPSGFSISMMYTEVKIQ